MTNKSNLLAMSFALALLSACTTTPNQAPVVDRTTPPAVKPATPAKRRRWRATSAACTP
jgi:lipoprotein NlpD